MLTGLAALESTDWSKLHHAYGRATDTPGHLLALLNEDAESRGKAMTHLWSAVIHQGTPWTATAPAALVVAGLLSDPRIDRGEPIRPYLLQFLGSVAEVGEGIPFSREKLDELAAFDLEPLLDAEDSEAIYEDEEAADAFFARSILGCQEVAPVLMQVMLDGLANESPRARTYAAMGAVTLAKTQSLRSFAPDLETQLLALALEAQSADERSAHVLALGDLGYSPLFYLNDFSPAVQMSAALAPSLATNSAALNLLLYITEHYAGEMDQWFEDKPPQFVIHPRFYVVARLVQQVKEFERLVDAAIAILDVTSSLCVDHDWGPLLAAAFPEGDGLVETEAQQRFLCAFVANDEFWDPRLGNAFKWFQKAGLPREREACAEQLVR